MGPHFLCHGKILIGTGDIVGLIYPGEGGTDSDPGVWQADKSGAPEEGRKPRGHRHHRK